MDRDFRRGYLEIDFPTEAFHSPLSLLLRAIQVFFSNLGLLTGATLIVFLPGKLAIQFGAYLLDIPQDGLYSYLLQGAGDLLLGALAVPAIVYGLLRRFRTGSPAPLAECLRWGRRQWLKSLVNQVKVEVTIALWAALLVIPGVVAMVRLAFAGTIVAIEGDVEPAVLARSTSLAHGRRWRIFFVLFPLLILDLAATFLVLGRVEVANVSRAVFALADCMLALAGQLTTVAVLLMYLGTVEKRVPTRKR